MTEVDTVLLDIDGTLLDSSYQFVLAWDRAFAATGHPVELWRLHRHIGMGGDRLVAAVAGDEVEEERGDEIRGLWQSEYDALIEQTRLLDGAPELLVALRERGLKVALASSSLPEHAEHATRLLHADRLADVATTGDDAEESKPDPELPRTALDQVGGARAVMVGDATWDVESARRMGVPTIGVLSGGYGRQELLDAGAVAVYDGPRDLLDHLDEALSTAGAAHVVAAEPA